LPGLFTGALLASGQFARRQGEPLAAATFLAGAALAIAPSSLVLLAEANLLGKAPAGITQLFGDTFTNRQVLAAALTALAVSMFGLWRLRMTGFAWTTAALATASYVALLLQFNWLEQPLEIQALWGLPLIGMELVALALERRGRVRWTTPFHLVALVALVVGLDVVALNGPTLRMLGLDDTRWAYFDQGRLEAFSCALNGLIFLGFMLMAERSPSLDLRRASRLLEILAILHILTALFANALNHRDDPDVRADVWLYLAAAAGLAALAPFRSRWRLLVGGLAGCGLGSYLLVELGLVARTPFIIGLGGVGLVVGLGTFVYVQQRQRAGGVVRPSRRSRETARRGHTPNTAWRSESKNPVPGPPPPR
jgi:hypothetical protein